MVMCTFVIEALTPGSRCMSCRRWRVIHRGGAKRRFRDLPIGRRRVWIELTVP